MAHEVYLGLDRLKVRVNADDHDRVVYLPPSADWYAAHRDAPLVVYRKADSPHRVVVRPAGEAERVGQAAELDLPSGADTLDLRARDDGKGWVYGRYQHVQAAVASGTRNTTAAWTRTPLPAGGVYETDWLRIDGNAEVSYFLAADQPGTFEFQYRHSPDGFVVVLPSVYAPPAVRQGRSAGWPPEFRARYANGPAAQGKFELVIGLHPVPLPLGVGSAAGGVGDPNSSHVVRAVMYGEVKGAPAFTARKLAVDENGVVQMAIPGVTGLVGPKGDKGDPGPQGPQGPPGATPAVPQIQHVRGVPVTTAPFKATWPTPFPDANYAVTFGLRATPTASGGPVLRVTAQTAADVTFAVANPAAGFSVDVIGVR